MEQSSNHFRRELILPPNLPRALEFFGVLDPTFAAAGETDAALAIIERNRSFLRDYADCLGRFRRGERDVILPAGTWSADQVE